MPAFEPIPIVAQWVQFLASVATVLGAAGVGIAAISYLRAERRASASERAAQALRVHEMFQQYLHMRLEASLAPLSRQAGVKGPLTSAKLYALEEMLARVKLHGNVPSDQDWMGYGDPEYGPWVATLLSHLGTDSEAIKESLTVSRECYSTDLIALAAEYIDDGELRVIAAKERDREVRNERTPPTLAVLTARRQQFRSA